MNISQVINTENNPVKAKVCGTASKEFTSLSEVEQVKTGSRVYCDEYQSAALIVSGDFVGEIQVMGYYAEGVNKNLRVRAAATEQLAHTITKPGCYLIDLCGLNWFVVRVDKYTSGTISANGTMFVKPLPNFAKRNELVATALGVTIPANSASNIILDRINIEEYPYQYVVARTNTGGKIKVKFNYKPNKQGTMGPPLDSIVVLETVTRGASDWIEAKGQNVTVYVDNGSDADLTCDVYLYGVR